jgi:hypothetical protein
MNWKDYKKLSEADKIDIWPTLTEEIQKQILKQKAAAYDRKLKDEVMKSLGLTKVKGSVSGKTYWE